MRRSKVKEKEKEKEKKTNGGERRRGKTQWDGNTYANVANYEHSLGGISIFITALLS